MLAQIQAILHGLVFCKEVKYENFTIVSNSLLAVEGKPKIFQALQIVKCPKLDWLMEVGNQM